MIDGDYVKLNTSIHTASNTSELHRDSEGNIDATIELRLPDNLWGSVNKEVEKVTMQTAKMRLSMEETPIAQIPLDLSLTDAKRKTSSCKLDVYPFVLLDDDEIAPTSLDLTSFPFYKSHFIDFQIKVSENSDPIYVVVGNADDEDYFGLSSNDNPYNVLVRQVVDKEKLVTKIKHKMNLMISSSHEALQQEGSSIYLKNYATLEQMFQDALENAMTYASTECIYVYDILLTSNASSAPYPEIKMDIEVSGVTQTYYYLGVSYISSTVDNHLAYAVKPRVRFGADTFQISYDTAAFKDIVPILWNTPYVQTYDYPEQLKIDVSGTDEKWYQPPPKRAYKYGVNSSDAGYAFTLLNKFKSRVMNVVANEMLYRTFSFLPWIKLPSIQSSNEDQVYKMRNCDIRNIYDRTEIVYITLSEINDYHVDRAYTYTAGSAITPVYTFKINRTQTSETITPSNWNRIFNPFNRYDQMCSITIGQSQPSSNTFTLQGDDRSLLTSASWEVSSTYQTYADQPPNLSVVQNTSEWYYSNTLPTSYYAKEYDHYILFNDKKSDDRIRKISDSDEQEYSNVVPWLYPDVSTPAIVSNTRHLMDYALGIPPVGEWDDQNVDSNVQYTHFIPPFEPNNVTASYNTDHYEVTVTFPALKMNRWVVLRRRNENADIGYTVKTRRELWGRFNADIYKGLIYERQRDGEGKCSPNIGKGDCYVLDGTTCDVTIENAEPIRIDEASGKKYRHTGAIYEATREIDETGFVYSGSATDSTVSYQYVSSGTSKNYPFSIPGGETMYCISITEDDLSLPDEAPWTVIKATWRDAMSSSTSLQTSTAGLIEDTLQATSPKYSITSSSASPDPPQYTDTIPAGFTPNVIKRGDDIVDSESFSEWVTDVQGTQINTRGWIHVCVNGVATDVPLIPYTPSVWGEGANRWSYRPATDPIIVVDPNTPTRRYLIWEVDPFYNSQRLWSMLGYTSLYPVYQHSTKRTQTATVRYREDLYTTTADHPEETAVSTSHEGNVRLTFTWNNIPTVVLSPIQSIVLVLQGMQVQAEIQPINIAQAGGSSLTSSIPVIENFYSLAATLRDLHDELVVTKDTFEDTATYALSTRAGYDRSIQISAKYIAKDGSLHQIKIPPNGVFSLQLIFKVSFYSSY